MPADATLNTRKNISMTGLSSRQGTRAVAGRYQKPRSLTTL